MNNYRPNQGRNHGNQEKRALFDKERIELESAIKNKKPALIIEVAKKLATSLSRTETTQTRKFLDEIVKVHPYQIDINKSPEIQLDSAMKNSLAILRPRFAYTVTRKGAEDLKAFYVELLDPWLAKSESFTELDLEYLHLFIESFIAYHKVEKVKEKNHVRH